VFHGIVRAAASLQACTCRRKIDVVRCRASPRKSKRRGPKNGGVWRAAAAAALRATRSSNPLPSVSGTSNLRCTNLRRSAERLQACRKRCKTRKKYRSLTMSLFTYFRGTTWRTRGTSPPRAQIIIMMTDPNVLCCACVDVSLSMRVFACVPVCVYVQGVQGVEKHVN